MAESTLHKRLEATVAFELEREGYRVFVEPAYPPVSGVEWTDYRPDLFGIRSKEEGDEDYIIVECETRPNIKRFNSKNLQLEIFPRLFQKIMLRRVLAVPTGTLRFVEFKLRKNWEIWVLGHKEPYKIPSHAA